MIQRIQSVYLLLSIICLSIVTFGVTIFYFETKDEYTTFTSYGFEKFNQAGKKSELISQPYFILTILVILLSVLAIFSYKNLKRQINLCRFILLFYAFIIIALICVFIYWKSIIPILPHGEANLKFGLGFFLLIVGAPFIFLANQAIRRDKKLLDSLNRLR